MELLRRQVSALRATALACHRNKPSVRMVMEITAARLASFPLHLVEDPQLTRLFIFAEGNMAAAMTLHDQTMESGLWSSIAPIADKLLSDAISEAEAFARRLEEIDPG